MLGSCISSNQLSARVMPFRRSKEVTRCSHLYCFHSWCQWTEMIRCHCGWLESVPSLVLEYHFSFGLLPSMQPQKTTRCQSGHCKFCIHAFVFTFIPRWWCVCTPGHLTEKWSWSELQHKMSTGWEHMQEMELIPREKLNKKTWEEVRLAYFFFKQANYNIYPSFPIFG